MAQEKDPTWLANDPQRADDHIIHTQQFKTSFCVFKEKRRGRREGRRRERGGARTVALPATFGLSLTIKCAAELFCVFSKKAEVLPATIVPVDLPKGPGQTLLTAELTFLCVAVRSHCQHVFLSRAPKY